MNKKSFDKNVKEAVEQERKLIVSRLEKIIISLFDQPIEFRNYYYLVFQVEDEEICLSIIFDAEGKVVKTKRDCNDRMHGRNFARWYINDIYAFQEEQEQYNKQKQKEAEDIKYWQTHPLPYTRKKKRLNAIK